MKNKNLIIFLILLDAICIAIPALAWEKQTVESSLHISSGMSNGCFLTIDDNGTRHMAFGSGNVYYAAQSKNGEWQREAVGADYGVRVFSLHIDSAGRPNIFYYDPVTISIKWALKEGAAWKTETVRQFESEGYGLDWGFGSAPAALDSEGYPHIVYYFANTLTYRYFDGTDWNNQTVVEKGWFGLEANIYLSAQDIPHIVYAYTNYGADVNLGYAFLDGSQLIDDPFLSVEKDTYGFTLSFILDADDSPHVAMDLNDLLVYMHSSDDEWSSVEFEDTTPVRWLNTIALDAFYNPFIAYTTASESDNAGVSAYPEYVRLRYADNSVWQSETIVGGGDKISSIALAVDSNNNAELAYINASPSNEYTAAVNHAFKNGSEWITAPVAREYLAGSYCGLVLDAHNKPHIAYRDETNEVLKYAADTKNNWQIETVGAWIGADINNPNVLLDSTGAVHIVYTSENTLKHAVKSGEGWSTQDIDFGFNHSAVIDAGDTVHISYMSYSGIKYATINGSTVESSSISSGFISHTAIAVAADSGIVAAYIHSAAGNTLQAARLEEGETWNTETIEESARGPIFMRTDTNGTVHLIYNTTDVLKHAWHENDAWQRETIYETPVSIGDFVIDGNGVFHFTITEPFWNGEPLSRYEYAQYADSLFTKEIIDEDFQRNSLYSSLALDSGGNIHVAYYDDIRGCLKYAVNEKCPLEATFPSKAVLSSLRSIRDKLLAGGSKGRFYVRQYYTHANEIKSLLQSDPLLKKRLSQLVKAVLHYVTKNENTSLILETIENDGLGFIDYMSEQASPGLKTLLSKLKKDIVSGNFIQADHN